MRKGLVQVPVRLDPLAVLVSEDHPLAALKEVPLGVLADFPLDAMAGNPATTGRRPGRAPGRGVRAHLVHATRAADRIPRDGPLLQRHREPVLATAKIGGIPGAVVRPMVNPVPLTLENLVFPEGLRHPGLDALLQAVTEFRRVGHWLRQPPHSWLPEADVALLRGSGHGRGDGRLRVGLAAQR